VCVCVVFVVCVICSVCVVCVCSVLMSTAYDVRHLDRSYLLKNAANCVFCDDVHRF
jgi:Na+-transporting NADH:ubiquinone oxidoreductase subunit NqrC